MRDRTSLRTANWGYGSFRDFSCPSNAPISSKSANRVENETITILARPFIMLPFPGFSIGLNCHYSMAAFAAAGNWQVFRLLLALGMAGPFCQLLIQESPFCHLCLLVWVATA